jgi:nicotinamidase-related amidase
MPLTQLDTAAALIVIDLQKGIVGLPTVHPAAEIIERSAQLARAFRERGLPVVLVNVADRAPGRTDAGSPKFAFPPDWTELIPELERQPSDILITKAAGRCVHRHVAGCYSAGARGNPGIYHGSRDGQRRGINCAQRLRLWL